MTTTALIVRREHFRFLAIYNRRMRQAIKKSIGKCERCDTKQHLTIHHKIRKSDGGCDYPYNFLILCKECHEQTDYEELLPLIIKHNNPIQIHIQRLKRMYTTKPFNANFKCHICGRPAKWYDREYQYHTGYFIGEALCDDCNIKLTKVYKSKRSHHARQTTRT